MKKYLLFAGGPVRGGWADFEGAYDSPDEACARVVEVSPDWWQIVDGATGDVIDAEEVGAKAASRPKRKVIDDPADRVAQPTVEQMRAMGLIKS